MRPTIEQLEREYFADPPRRRSRFAVAVLAIFAVTALLFWPLFAVAQEAAVQVFDDQGLKLAQDLFDAIARGDWWMVAGVGVAFVVWLLRRPFRRFLPAGLQRVLDMPVIAFSVPILVSLAGGFSAAALAGPLTGPVVVAVVLGALKTSMAAAFSFLFGANLQEQVAKPVGPSPQEQGAAAGATVTSLSEARDTLAGKGPQP